MLLNAVNGDKLWNFSTGEGVESAPAITGGVVYTGSGEFNDGNVYALNAADGAELWNYTNDGLIVTSPAVVNGVIYIGSYNNNLVYALGNSSASSYNQLIIVGVLIVVVIIATVVFLMFRKRLKTKPTNPQLSS